MADTYFKAGATGLKDGSSWTDAYDNFDTAVAGVPKGDRLFCQGNWNPGSVGIVLDNNGTVDDPIIIIGCKSGTTNEPPVAADIIDDRNDVDIPIIKNDNFGIAPLNFAYVWGIAFHSQDSLDSGSTNSHLGWIFEECELFVHGGQNNRWLLVGNDNYDQFWRLINCRVKFSNTASHYIIVFTNGMFEWFGGELAHTSTGIPTLLGNVSIGGTVIIRGVDLAAGMTSTGVMENTAGRMSGAQRIVDRCKVPSSFTVGVSTGFLGWSARARAFASRNTASGITGSVQDLTEICRMGSVADESTVVRTGGADDGDTGGHALAMDLNPSATTEAYLPLQSPELHGWIEGDGTTTKTITVYLCNDASESAANLFEDDEVWLDVWYPSGAGDTVAEFVTTKPALLVAPVDLATDGSTWGTGGNNKQKIVVTLDGSPHAIPDYNGPVTVVVNYAKRHATPPTLYLDPQLNFA